MTCPHWDTTLFRGVDIFERPGHPKYPMPVGYPGHEVSGRVEAVGEGVTSLRVGDRVATLKAGGESNPGFYSELILLTPRRRSGVEAKYHIWYIFGMKSPGKAIVARFYRSPGGREPVREWLGDQPWRTEDVSARI